MKKLIDLPILFYTIVFVKPLWSENYNTYNVGYYGKTCLLLFKQKIVYYPPVTFFPKYLKQNCRELIISGRKL